MLLENKYFKVESQKTDGDKTVFHIAILPDCDVYRGHFPGKPICPGVCNIETIKECASLLTGRRLVINTIKRCRFTVVATPAISPELSIEIRTTPIPEGFSIEAVIYDEKQQYMDYKGEMTAL